MKKIRVLEVIGGMDMGGAETFLMNVLRNIDKRKFELNFLVYGDKYFDYEDELRELGGVLIRVKKPRNVFDFGLVKQIRGIIKSRKIDIVHAHTYFNSMYAVLAAKQSSVKRIIVHSHNTRPDATKSVIKKGYYIVSKYIINKYATVFLACGLDAGKSLFYKKNAFIVIDNGIIVERFKYSDKIRENKRKELGVADDDIVLLHVGRFDEQKNHRYLINIFDCFLEQNPNSILLLAGDGKLKKEIVDKVSMLGIKDKVRFLGKRSDVNELLSVADAVVFPSLYEGLPVSLIEAQVNGIPIVASVNIDKDVDFTDSIDFVPVNISCNDWADILSKKIGKRYDNYDIAVKSEYNIDNSIKKLERVYEKDIKYFSGE